jgi:ufm1-conjugating enzyme 1
MDDALKNRLKKIPLQTVRAGPRDPEWTERLKQEYTSIIAYITNNKADDNDWFTIESNKDGTSWFGKCWYFHAGVRYEFKLQFDIPVTYPEVSPEIELPELDGLTPKMYRGGKVKN